jgi:hypothetical protein
MSDLLAQRRALLLAPLLAALPLTRQAVASKLDPTKTVFTLPKDITWNTQADWPQNSNAHADLFSNVNQPGLYCTLIRWYPGYMSAPHKYVTDRLCVVLSSTWWINSGEDFDPASCVPVPAGTFVHRVAETWHYDGVIASGKEPVEIAICGMGPVRIAFAEPDKPGWRKV